MRKFLKKLLLCLALILASFLLLRAYTMRNRAKNHNSAFVDKLKILLKNKDRKKIVLIGGSSVGFGISAELIEQQTGIKAINLGLHAGLGLTDAQQFIIKNLRKDDIIVFAPEWIFYQNPYFFDPGTIDNLVNNNLAYGILIDKPGHILQSVFSPIALYEFSHAGMLNKIGTSGGPPYVYDCLNVNGDIISHCGLKPQGVKRYAITDQKFNFKRFIAAFPFINQYRTIIVFPPTQVNVYQKNTAYFKDLESSLAAGKLTVLDDVQSNVYPDSCFFDAEYHLTCESRATRTQKIVKYLKSNL